MQQVYIEVEWLAIGVAHTVRWSTVPRSWSSSETFESCEKQEGTFHATVEGIQGVNRRGRIKKEGGFCLLGTLRTQAGLTPKLKGHMRYTSCTPYDFYNS